MNLECKVCGHVWDYKGKAKRAQCGKCRWNGKVTYIKTTPNTTPTTPDIKDDIMQGNILDALDKADINPTNHRELFKDAIPLILKEDKLKFAFAEACQDRRRSPESVVRNAVRFWLKEKRYLK